MTSRHPRELSRFGLLWRNLRHYLAADIAVIAGMAVAAAVLTGALMVGDSVRGSLADMALARMGPVDDALVSPRFFSAALAQRIAANPKFRDRFKKCVAGVSVRGGASTEQPVAHTAGVSMMAVSDWVAVPPGHAVINNELADALGQTKSGGDLLLSLPNILRAPADATLARRGRSDTIASARVIVDRLAAPPSFEAMFNLAGGQRLPRNAWMNLTDLQEAIGEKGRANLLLVQERTRGEGEGSRGGATTAGAAGDLDAMLAGAVTLDDYGLSVGPAGVAAHRMINSRSTYIPPAIDAAVEAVAWENKIPLQRVSAYLANEVRTGANTIHYAIIAGITDVDGQSIPNGGVVLNQWAAGQLHAAVGDAVSLQYYRRNNNGDLAQVASNSGPDAVALRVARIIATAGIGADPTLTPDYPGLTDTDSIADWHPPEGIVIDRGKVTKADEAYWKAYRAAPKMFVNLADAHRLWGGGAYGDITSLRVPADRADEFAKALLARVRPADMGFSFRAIKADQIAAAQNGGANDFSVIFISFSFFLIVAAVLLVAMLFRLAVEQRARQLGLMSAIGFTPWTIRRLLLSEGVMLAVIGSAIGIVAGIGYTALMMAGLRTWWVDAVGTTQLRLHVDPATLATGFISSVIVALLAVWWGARRVGKVQAARLLAGAWGNEMVLPLRRVWIKWLGIVMWIGGVALIVAGIAHALSAQTAFMSGGGILLAACLLELSWRIRPRRSAMPGFASSGSWGTPAFSPSPGTTGEGGGEGSRDPHANVAGAPVAPNPHPNPLPEYRAREQRPGTAAVAPSSTPPPLRSLDQLGLRNAGRNPARSVMIIALIAFATFTLVTIASMRSSLPPDVRDPKSGAGGYDLMITTDLPLYGNPATKAGREVLGFTDAGDPQWDKLNFISMRSSGGQDVSCLNLTKPNQPTLLSVPQAMIDQNHFTFASVRGGVANPWTLLRQVSARPHPNAIPVIADDDTAQYILHTEVGQTLPITDEAGNPRQLLLVATLSSSIFQGQLLVSEANFTQLFPSKSGTHVLLISTPADKQAEVSRRLGDELADYSATVDSTADVLASYQRVANTYMATFQTLGSLGLLLGTIGLAVVLLRSLIERRAELAMLAALGFARWARLRLVLAENVALLALGLFVGAACAIIAVLPALLSTAHQVHLIQLGVALAAIFATGVAVLVITLLIGSKRSIAQDLHFE